MATKYEIAEDVIRMARALGVKQYVLFNREMDRYGENDEFNLVEELPVLSRETEAGVCSAIAPMIAVDVSGSVVHSLEHSTHYEHVFMADCDKISLHKLRDLDPMYTLVRSSVLHLSPGVPHNFHIYGPKMSWEQMTGVWADLKKLRLVEQKWIDHQLRRGFATLRVTNNLKHHLPVVVSTIVDLQKIPKVVWDSM